MASWLELSGHVSCVLLLVVSPHIMASSLSKWCAHTQAGCLVTAQVIAAIVAFMSCAEKGTALMCMVHNLPNELSNRVIDA